MNDPPVVSEDEIRSAARGAGVVVLSVAFDSAEIEVGGTRVSAYFGNLRPVLSTLTSEGRIALLTMFLQDRSRFAETPESPTIESIRSRVMPRLGPAGHSADLDSDARPARWTLVEEHLAVYLVVDEPSHLWYVQPRHLEEWRSSYEALYDCAYENLAKSTDPTKVKTIRGPPGLFSYFSGDSFDASRCLLLGQLAAPWPEHGCLFAAPTRDHLLFAPIRNGFFLKDLNGLIELGGRIFAEQGYRISDQPFWFDGQTWERIPLTRAGKKFAVAPSDRFNEMMIKLVGQHLKEHPEDVPPSPGTR